MSETLYDHLFPASKYSQVQNHLDRFLYDPCNTYGRRPFYPSAVLRSIYSNIVKPIMRESFVRCEPLRWIKVCQTSDKILEVRVKGLHIPSDERFKRVLLVEAVSKRFQHLAPRAVAEVS